MASSIFIPKRINVGFQERKDTYTKKLAYIIYYDSKGVLRKEKSWDGWRDQKIDNVIFDNVPTEGFVLNKKVGDYSSHWNHRQAYVRVYDSRNFEFEITVENLLYILENTSSIKGKGLDGFFVYGWGGKDLLLIPTSSPDYIEISAFSNILNEKKTIKAKDLILGATYKTKQNEEWIYMGRFDCHSYGNHDKNRFWFYNNTNKDSVGFEQVKTLSGKLIQVTDANCCNNYAELFDVLECLPEYSPIDPTKDEFEYYDLEGFTEIVNAMLEKNYYRSREHVYCDLEDGTKAYMTVQRKNNNCDSRELKCFRTLTKIEKYKSTNFWNRDQEYEKNIQYDEILAEGETIEELFNKIKPQYKNIYLQNGKLKGGNKNNE